LIHIIFIKINTWLIYSVNALEDAFAAMLLVVMLTLVMHYSPFFLSSVHLLPKQDGTINKPFE